VATGTRTGIELTCDTCGKKFKRPAWVHRANIRRGRLKTYCSTECAGKGQYKKAVVKTESQRIKAAKDGFMERCPSCGEKFLKVIKSQLTKDKGRQRNKHCQHCNYRVTTYEITNHQYQELINGEQPLCHNCTHNTGEHCDLSFPEYMTSEASDCHFKC